MIDPRPQPDADPGRPSATGSWRPDAPPQASNDPPTVITGSGSAGSVVAANPSGTAGSGSGFGSGAGSGSGSGSGAGSGSGGGGSLWPSPGDRIDWFQLEQAIGIGGMGAVFRAIDTRLDRVVALKVLPPDQAEDAEVIQRFYQEGRAAARLDHENIAGVYSIGRDARYHYIAFEYIDGQTLRQKVDEKGPLPIQDAVNYTLQVAGALGHAVERGVVHRDIKPSNIIITPQGRAKLVDMGLARRFERGRDTGLTQSGMTLGTFDYISPEQARDPRDVDVRGDLYSLGCTLFHMLTGRPPFPDGTVLQKLLQHQEEPPPDVRSINPAVPAEVAAVVRKLMVKDRDRRYQTPDALIRDLLVIAGGLGLRPVSPEGLVWLEPSARPAWERHLVWGVPVLAFSLLVGILFWVNEPPRPSAGAGTNGAGLASVRGTGPGAISDPLERFKIGDPARSGTATAAAAGPNGPASASPATGPPREIEVDSGEDLLQVATSAPRGSTLVLVDAGPYLLRTPADGPRLRSLDLTIRADQNIRPRLRMSGLALRAANKPAALLDWSGGRLVLDGLDLEGHPALESLIRAEDTDLTLRQCNLFRPGASGQSQSALRLISTGQRGPDGRTLAAATITASHIDGGPYAIRAEGAVEVALLDCTVGPADQATIASDHPGASSGPAEFRLARVSVITGAGEVFEASGLPPRIRTRDCVFAPETDDQAGTLILADDPNRLDYRGVDNLYGRIKAYLRSSRTAGNADPATVRDFASWSNDASQGIRESGSVALDQVPWQPVGSEVNQPSSPFRVAAPVSLLNRLGARSGPSGTLPAPTLLAADTPNMSPAPAPGPASAAPIPVPPEIDATALALAENPFQLLQRGLVNQSIRPDLDPNPVGNAAASRPNGGTKPGSSGSRETPERTPRGDDLENLPPPMAPVGNAPARNGLAGRPTNAEGQPGPEPNEEPDLFGGAAIPPPMLQVVEDTRKGAGATENPAAKTAANPGSTAASPPRAGTDSAGPAREVATVAGGTAGLNPNVIRTATELVQRIGQNGKRGGTLDLPPEADWELPSLTVNGTGVWVIRGSNPASARRPRLRLRSFTAVVAMPGGAAPAVNVRSGGLRLEGIDLVVPAADRPPGTGLLAAFGLHAGADLNLTNCTITIEGAPGRSAMVAVLDEDHRPRNAPDAPPPIADRAEPAGLPPTIRIKDCLIRLGGVLVDVAAGGRLDLGIENAAIATGGSLVHGHGRPRGRAGETLKVDLRQITARLTGGLVYLESRASEPELPVAEVIVRESVLANNGDGTPLFRLDGQDDPDTLRDRLRWRGSSVAYHLISLYRRDQSTQPGAIPSVFDRASWDVLAGPREESAIHGDLRFQQNWDSRRPAWLVHKDDLRLGKDSPASSIGADLTQIPDAPHTP